MKKLIAFSAFLLLAEFSFSQTPKWLWAESSGGGNYEYGQGISASPSGNIYMSGRMSGTINLGSISSTTTGFSTGFKGRFNSSGVFSWISNNPLSSGFDYPVGFTRDKNDNTYETGMVNSGSALFLDKYNNSGILQWSDKIVAGATGSGIAVDDTGNVYLAGFYSNSITFGTTTLNALGAQDIFLAKFDSLGTAKWAVSAGGTGADETGGIVLDAANNIFFCGSYGGAPAFGTINPIAASAGSSNFFIAKYDNAGNALWITPATNAEEIISPFWVYCPLSVDANGNLYTAGNFRGPAQFGNTLLTSNGSDDIFVAKCLSNGQWDWVKQAGGTGDDFALGIALDKLSNLYITGYYTGNASFGDSTVTGTGQNTYVAKLLNNNGKVLWVQTAQGTSGEGITADNQGFIYITGSFQGSAKFGQTTLTAASPGNIFVAKLDTTPRPNTINVFAANGYCAGVTIDLPYDVSGTFNTGNVFTAQLSDSTGSFASPVNIGSEVSTTVGTISIIIPANTISGTNYLIRIISSNSLAIGTSAFFISIINPVVSFISVSSGLQTTFHANTDVGITNYMWDFGAGASVVNFSGEYPPVIGWASAGTHIVCLTETNAECSATKCDTVIVTEQITCQAYFTLYPDTTTPHHWFALNQSIGKTPVTYNWAWGDGNTSTGANPSHTYATAGYYPICLTINDDTLCTSTFCDSSTYLYRMDADNAVVTINVVSSLPTNTLSISENKYLTIFPNPCLTCEIKTTDAATDFTVIDLLGRTAPVKFIKTAGGYTMNFNNNQTGIFLLRNVKTGEVVKFVRE